MTNAKKYEAIMLLHALGDTIGFKNGDWEFNYHDSEKKMELDYVNELIYEFIHLGGVNGLDVSKWIVSDDTLLHISIARSLLNYKDSVNDKFLYNVKTSMDDTYTQILEDSKGNVNRYIGLTTEKSIRSFTKEHDARFNEYNDFGGGNGCAMRTHVIGMCFSGENRRDELIDISVLSSRFTHNNAIGYLGGFTSALFTALAIENVDVHRWPYILVKYLNSKKLKSYLDVNNLDQSYDHTYYMRQWEKYIDTRFDNEKPISVKSFHNPLFRIKYFYDNFSKGTPEVEIGGSAYLCTIMAYDALIECGGNWEKLIVYAILHPGDSDTIGSVAAGWYGALYGFGDVPKHMLENIEYEDELKELAKDLYKKFNK